MTRELQLEDLLTPGRIHRLRIQEPLGTGAQGEVFRVLLRGDPRPRALKLYPVPPDHPDGRHVIQMVERLRPHTDLQLDPGLALPVMVGREQDSGRTGVLLPFIPGEPLEGVHYRRIYEQGLSSRLWIAAGLARALARLHAHGVVHGDLAEPNLLVRQEGSRIIGLTLIDIDGGGIIGPSGSWILLPRVGGHPQGSLLAPEMLQGQQPYPDPATERWALAVILHNLLFGGTDPFFYVACAMDIGDPRTPWPPPSHFPGSKSMREALGWHQRTLRGLGERLQQYFRQTFAPPRSRALRPAPEDWANALEVAARWVMPCPGCGQEVVGERRLRCPECRTPLPHAWIRTPSGHPLPLCAEGQALTGRDLGLGGAEARELLLCFRRLETGEIQVQPIAMPARPMSPRGVRPLPDGTLALSPGRHRLQIPVGKGRPPREIRLEIPSPGPRR